MSKYNWKTKRFDGRIQALKNELHRLYLNYSARPVERQTLGLMARSVERTLTHSKLKHTMPAVAISRPGARYPLDLISFFIYRHDKKVIKFSLQIGGWKTFLLNEDFLIKPGDSIPLHEGMEYMYA